MAVSGEDGKLIRAAKKARRGSYAPYTNFPVGAALLGGSGKVYTGCNVESANPSLDICAERLAAAKALASGERASRAIAIVAQHEPPMTPCPLCRDYLSVFGQDLRVVMANMKGEVRALSLAEVMQEPYEKPSHGAQGRRHEPRSDREA